MKPQPSEFFYKLLFNNALDGLAYCRMIFDKKANPVDFIYIKVNKQFEKITGLKEAEGKRVTEIIPGINATNPELFEIYGRVSLVGKPERFETYVKPLARWFLVSAYSPQKQFFVAIFQNITKQKEMEKTIENAKIAAQNVLEDLQAEKEKLDEIKAKDEAMLESIGEGLIGVDKDRKIIIVNKAAEKMLGWKTDEIIGKEITSLPLADENGNILPLEKRPTFRALLKNKSISSTYYFIRRDKTKFPISVIVTPIILNGKTIGAIDTFRDITREREIDTEKSEFVSLASHQLRTPLGIIKWYLDAWKNEDYFKKAPTVIRGYFDEVYKSNERLLSLVRDLLSVSRIDQGKIKNVPKSVNPIQLVTEIVEQMLILAHKKKVILDLTIQDKTIPAIYIDTIRFREVVENLISNSLHYTKTGGRVDVNLYAKDHKLLVQVKDTGIGMNSEDQKKIFTKFFRSQEAIIQNPEGTGLGLYVVKSYVEGWGGKIAVESAEGKGSIFTITLPIATKKSI